ncbi:hypothetical protein J7376_12955 [Paracoccus sp. R12_1]|jgi:hypothetical protein|uniref:hypothetical protein n=1 Tax=unclassified Paracoccus (in: a-proteobacteria) TaxID=2688777 RepID=UPI000C0940B5|nr:MULTISPECIES: hypothetical protein [unclassified Paracoccus (in: a-proteobacteria)]MBO9456273.1 hypothetical protein [Paracoccus sp. R12_2]MBO9487435.1 hypothetical protein [Paracoccus sp. R12_1]PHQ66412.1 MAG: hypothetical protein COB97_11545 [Paracoccus sp. (in: a-proteobacteria)]
MNVFEIVIWAGAALTLAGLAALIWCILTVARARRAGLDDQALRVKMRGVIAVNMGALAASTIGLMLVVVGIFLGK